MNNLDIIARIDKRLKEAGTPKMEFYKRCGISAAAVSQWRTGKTKPTFEALQRMANELDVSFEYLVAGESDREPKAKTPNNQELKNIAEALSKAAKALEANGVASEPALTLQESELLDLLRQLPDDKKETALEVIRAMALASKAL